MDDWNLQNRILLKELEFLASVGVYDFEKRQKQPIICDCALYFDFKNACVNDDILQTINYEEVLSCLQNTLQSQHFLLIEALAYTLLKQLFERFPQLRAVHLLVKKPSAIAQKEAYAAIDLYQERRKE